MQAARGGARAGPASAQSQQSWGDWMSSGLAQRTQNLNIMGDSMDRLEENASGWAEDVNKFVAQQKRKMVIDVVKSKLF